MSQFVGRFAYKLPSLLQLLHRCKLSFLISNTLLSNQSNAWSDMIQGCDNVLPGMGYHILQCVVIIECGAVVE
jgi:hypothetical protein